MKQSRPLIPLAAGVIAIQPKLSSDGVAIVAGHGIFNRRRAAVEGSAERDYLNLSHLRNALSAQMHCPLRRSSFLAVAVT